MPVATPAQDDGAPACGCILAWTLCPEGEKKEGREEEAAPPYQLLYTCTAAVCCHNLLLRPIKDQLSYGFALVHTLYCRGTSPW